MATVLREMVEMVVRYTQDVDEAVDKLILGEEVFFISVSAPRVGDRW
ncbi:hypothetical protein ABZ636_40755 [Streptomyces sp. NPDC007251]